MLGRGLFKQAAKKSRKSVDGVGGFTRDVDEFVRHGKPCPKNIDAGINKVNG
jgi:hypothetical protein